MKNQKNSQNKNRFKQNKKSYNKAKSRNSNNKKQKEVEVNIDRDQLNKADLVHSSSKDYNDSGWYTKALALLRGSTSYNFAWPIGDRIGISNLATTTFRVSNASVPGILAMHYVPTVGVSTDLESPINQSMKQLHSLLQHTVSSSLPFDPADLGMYFQTIDSAYLLFAIGVRAYGALNAYSTTNKYYAEALVTALGFEVESLKSQLADFRYLLNLLAFNLNRYCVPKDLSFMSRHMWMNLNMFKDAPDGDRCQIYMYVPDGYYLYIDKDEDTPGYCNFVSFPTSITLANFRTMVSGILSILQNSEDLDRISSTILRAYGSSNLYTVTPIETYYINVPFYSAEVLAQIENAKFYGKVIDESMSITQEADVTSPNLGAIMAQPQLSLMNPSNVVGGADAIASYISSINKSGILFNLHTEDVTPDLVIVATRLIPNIGVPQTTTPTTIPVTSCGTELGTYIKIYQYGYSNESGALPWQLNSFELSTLHLVSASLLQPIITLTKINAFDWAPIIVLLAQLGSKDNILIGDTCDYDNYTEINRSDIYRMNETALISEYYSDLVTMLSSRSYNK